MWMALLQLLVVMFGFSLYSYHFFPMGALELCILFDYDLNGIFASRIQGLQNKAKDRKNKYLPKNKSQCWRKHTKSMKIKISNSCDSEPYLFTEKCAQAY